MSTPRTKNQAVPAIVEPAASVADTDPAPAVIVEPSGAIVHAPPEATALAHSVEEVGSIGFKLFSNFWKPCEGQSVVHLVPLVRTDNVRHMFPSTYESNANSPLHLWGCELAADVSEADKAIFAMGNPVAAKKGDLVLVFEPERWVLAPLFRAGFKRQTVISFRALGIKRVNSKRHGKMVQTWDYEEPQCGRRPFAITTTEIPTLDFDDGLTLNALAKAAQELEEKE